MKIEFVYCFLLIKIWTLISTSGTRFPRAVRPGGTCACGVSLGPLFPQESRTPAPINYV